MAHYYLSRWEWATEGSMSFWRAPQNALGCLDLRSLPQMSKTGGIPEGYGFFVYPAQVSGLDYYLGDETTLLSLAKKLAVKNLLNIPGNLTVSKILDILWELLVSKADLTGRLRWKPLMPGIDGKLKLYLGGHSLVKEELYSPAQHPLVLELLRNDYRRLRSEFQVIGSDHYRKVLSAWQDKYSRFGLKWQDFIPDDLPQEVPLPHSTTITESFNKADSDILGPDLSWTELTGDWDIVSNQAQMQTLSGSAVVRADTDLATDDHYSQMDVTILDTTGSLNRQVAPGTIIRKDSTTTMTFYHGRLNTYTAPVIYAQLYKFVTGAATQLGTNVEITLSIPDTVKTDADGSTIRMLFNGVAEITQTDTAITGNLRTGFRTFQDVSPSPLTSVDNFEAGDLAAFVPKVVMF